MVSYIPEPSLQREDGIGPVCAHIVNSPKVGKRNCHYEALPNRVGQLLTLVIPGLFPDTYVVLLTFHTILLRTFPWKSTRYKVPTTSNQEAAAHEIFVTTPENKNLVSVIINS